MVIPSIPRRDLLILAGGLIFLVVLAVFVKPIIAGTDAPVVERADLPDAVHDAHPWDHTGSQFPDATFSPPDANPDPPSLAPPLPSPTPAIYAGMPATRLPFIDPGVYNITFEQEGPERVFTQPPDVNVTRMITYAEIEGTSSGVSGPFSIPVPYWEIWYTINPRPSFVEQIGEPREQSVAEVRGAVWWPAFSLDLYEVTTPPRLVQTFTPDGGLDLDLWLNETNDPRPWKERFFSGNSEYFLVIHARNLDSYHISVMLPTEVNTTALIPDSKTISPEVPPEDEWW